MQASSITELFTHPTLRKGVTIQTTEEEISLIYRNQSCDISVDSKSRSSVLALLKTIEDSPKSIQELRNEYPTLSGSITPILKELDRLGLITEAHFDWPSDVLSGSEFNSHLRDLANRVMRRCKLRFFDLMTSGHIQREVLFGYVLEYYYLVRSAPGLIAPALAQADSRKNQRSIQKFFVSELDHDLMLAASLASVNIKADDLNYLQPLPSTFALCSALGVYAKQHLLSFKSILFLFEIPSIQFNNAFVDCCRKANLPDEFWQPLLRHAHINDALEHDDITANLLHDITAISAEEQLVVEKNLVLTIETMAYQDGEIIDYYSRPEALVPRTYM
jgi:hypothetical protein